MTLRARLKMGHQLALIVIALLIPLAYVGVQYAIGLDSRIRERTLADDGLAYYHHLKEAGHALASHAAYTAAVLAGDTNDAYFKPRIKDAAAHLDAAFAAQDEQERRYGLAGSPERALWAEIGQDWARLRKEWPRLTPEDSGARHDALAAKVMRLVRQIAQRHHLDRDSDLVQAYLQDTAVLQVPALAVDFGRLRAAAAPVAAQMMAVTQEQEAQINARLSSLHSLVEGVRWKLGVLATATVGGAPAAPGAIEAADRVAGELDGYESWLRANVLTRRPVAIPTEDVMQHGAGLDQQLAGLHDLLIKQVENRSLERVASQRSERNVAYALVTAMVLAAVLLAAFITRRVVRLLDRAIAAFRGIEQGDYTQEIPAGIHDEVGELLRSLSVMQSALRTRVETDRLALAENQRVRQALDNAGSIVLVANDQNQVVYANKAATTTFTRLGGEALPGLAARGGALVGAGLDLFQGVRELDGAALRAARTPTSAIVTLGPSTLVLGISPVLGEDGAWLGTVLEWRDRSMEVAVESEVRQVVARALEGALDARLDPGGKSEFHAALATGLNQILGNMAGILRTIRGATMEVSGSVEGIMRGNAELSTRTESQASSLEETASAMEQMTATVRQNADLAGQADQMAIAARSRAESGREVVVQAVSAMTEIHRSSAKIADIIGVIDEIAFQTNLLALNASVEAARAGDQGRGFAVVASEVRNLAGRSAEAAKEIKALINDSVQKVGDGARLVEHSGQALAEIVGSVESVTAMVGQIAAASREQSTGIEEVNRAITAMDKMTQENAALVQHDAAQSELLMGQVRSLGELVARYRLDDGDAPAATAAASRPAARGGGPFRRRASAA